MSFLSLAAVSGVNVFLIQLLHCPPGGSKHSRRQVDTDSVILALENSSRMISECGLHIGVSGQDSCHKIAHEKECAPPRISIASAFKLIKPHHMLVPGNWTD